MSVSQPAVIRSGTKLKDNHLIYYGRKLYLQSELKEPFQPNGKCLGWCKDSKQRQIATNLIMDKSRHHNEFGNNWDWGEGLATE